MYVLDTDMLSHLFANHPRVLARRNSVPSSEIATAIVTRIEVLQGPESMPPDVTPLRWLPTRGSLWQVVRFLPGSHAKWDSVYCS